MYKYEDVFTSSSDYASRFSGEIGQWLLQVQNQTILNCLQKRNEIGSYFLDVGGGHGQLQEVANSLGSKYLILASHIDAFYNLKQRNKSQQAGLVSDLVQFPFKDKSFSVVSSVRLISHSDDWRKLISEICRVCSDQVVIDYPPLASSNILYRIMFPIKKILEGNTRTFTIFTHKEIEEEFLKNGFKLKKRAGQFFWPMVLHRKIRNVAIAKMLEELAALFALERIFGNPTIAVYERF